MKKTTYVLILSVLVSFLFLSIAICAEETENEKLIFKWGFFYSDNQNTITPVDYEAPTQALSDKVRLKVYIKPVENVYIYLLQKDADGNLNLLFPQNFSYFSEYYSFGKDYYIPAGDNWFTPGTPSGEEIFYFLASRERLLKMESLLKKYFKNLNGMTEEKAETQQEVIEYIKKLRLEYSSFTPEKSEIVLIAGEFRGIEGSYEFPALDIEADTFYAKTIRITY